VKNTLRILNLNHVALRSFRRDYLAAIEKTIVSMGDQMDAIRAYLVRELSLQEGRPFYSAKQQHFSLQG
jgi:hypothetical protein